MLPLFLVFLGLGTCFLIMLSWIKTWKRVDEIREELRKDLNEWY